MSAADELFILHVTGKVAGPQPLCERAAELARLAVQSASERAAAATAAAAAPSVEIVDEQSDVGSRLQARELARVAPR